MLGNDRLAARIIRLELHAPAVIDVEVLQGLRRAWLVGRLNDAAAEIAVAGFLKTPIARHAVQPLVQRIWSLRSNITAHDAAYVALAESLGMPLITRDRRLAKASGHGARIDYID